MVRVFLTALFALAPAPEPRSAEDPPNLDRRCYGLMAQLAEAEDPQLRSAGFVGAQYFLGRLDSDGHDAAPAAAGEAGAARDTALLQRCAALMGAGGRDFRRLGESLIRHRNPV